MKGTGSAITRALPVGARIICHDNSGAKEVEIINVLNVKGALHRYPSAGIGDVVIASVKKGKPDMIKKIVRALIVRQKKAFRRASGIRISFEDNAAVLITEDGLPVGTEIKGVVAKEITVSYPKVSAIAAGIV